MHHRRFALTTLVVSGLTVGLVGCSSTSRLSGGDPSTTAVATSVVATSAVATTAPTGATVPPTQPPATQPPATEPGMTLYMRVTPPGLPPGHTDPFASSGVLADGVYWVTYNGGEMLTPDITVTQAFFGAECESEAAAAGQECTDGIFAPESPSRDISDLPFSATVDLTVSDASTQFSYWITPDELVRIRASSPSDGAPEGFGFTPFAFVMTVLRGEIVEFAQVWTP